MRNELLTLERDLAHWRSTLNQEGVWLFLATIGCWSIPVGWERVVALLLSVSLFGWRALAQQKDLKPFPKRCTEYEAMIRREATDEIERKAALYDLMVLREEYISLKSTRHVVVYIVTSGFWFYSFAMAIPERLSR